MSKLIQKRVATFEGAEPEEFYSTRKALFGRLSSLQPDAKKQDYFKHSVIGTVFSENALNFIKPMYLSDSVEGVQYGKALSFLRTHKEFLEKHLVKNDYLAKSYFATLAAATAQPQLLIISKDCEVNLTIPNGVGRLIVIIEDEVEATIKETEEKAAFGVHLIEYYIGRDAKLKHRSEATAKDTKRVVSRYLFLENNATLSSLSEQQDGTYLRDEYTVKHLSSGSDSRILGSHRLKGETYSDTRIDVIHAVSDTTNQTMYRYVLSDEAVGVFGGLITIAKGADKTEADMTTKAILVSDTAKMYGEPQLEIYTDDVICTHGASTGMIDDDAIFYLQSRGMEKDNAKKELAKSFLSEPLKLY